MKILLVLGALVPALVWSFLPSSSSASYYIHCTPPTTGSSCSQQRWYRYHHQYPGRYYDPRVQHLVSHSSIQAMKDEDRQDDTGEEWCHMEENETADHANSRWSLMFSRRIKRGRSSTDENHSISTATATGSSMQTRRDLLRQSSSSSSLLLLFLTSAAAATAFSSKPAFAAEAATSGNNNNKMPSSSSSSSSSSDSSRSLVGGQPVQSRKIGGLASKIRQVGLVMVRACSNCALF